jgi:hypothetical protein
VKEEEVTDWATQSVGEEPLVLDITEVHLAAVKASQRHLDKVDEAITKIEEMTTQAANLADPLDRRQALENVGHMVSSITGMATVQVALGAAYARLAKATRS